MIALHAGWDLVHFGWDSRAAMPFERVMWLIVAGLILITGGVRLFWTRVWHPTVNGEVE